MKRFLSLFCTLIATPLFVQADPDVEPGALASHYDLRVYGSLKTEDATPAGADYQHIRVTAQSAAKAKVLVSKFLRDYTVLPNVILSQTKVGESATLPAVAFEDGRRILPVLKPGESTVDFYLFAREMDLAKFVASSSGAVSGALDIEGRQYPYFFDFWDRHCMGTWYAPRLDWDGKYFTDQGNNSYQKHLGLNMNMGGSFMEAAAEADRYKIGYKFNRWLDVSSSAYDYSPESATRGDPDVTFLASYYGDMPFADNPSGYGQMDEMMAFYRQFNTDEFLTCITDPHGETGPGMDSFMGANQRDEFSRKDLIHYLRDMRKISLSDLGTRWYGDANKYKSWDDVTWPREREYYGWDDGKSQSQDLSGTWKLNGGTVAEGEAAGYQTPGYDDSKWFSFQQPGSSYIDVTHRQGQPGGWNRFSFTPDDLLAKSGKTVYLTVCPFNDSRYTTPDSIYFNGQKLGDLTFGYGFEWKQYDVTSLLKPGANVLAVHSQFGMMRGPTFLTLKKAEEYPTTDPTLNARWYDTREWIAEDVARGNARDVTYVRSACPEIPMKVMAYDSMIDVMNPYSVALGLVPHDTGESAFFRPWDKRYGYLRGIEDSSEPGQPGKNVEELKGLFFCMTMEGMNAHDYFINLTNILVDPAQKAWYDRNEPYLELMGAFDLKKPDIVIGRSLRVLRDFPTNVPEENDIGRGDIQGAKYSYVYTSERELADHLVGNYKIIIDDNMHALAPEDVDNLEAWVKEGGTLVLNQRSGREDPIKGTTWPVSKLLGSTPVIRPEKGTLTFDANPSILKAYAGKTFPNEGHVIDWQNLDYFSDSITIDDPGADASIIAKYDDGKPAIWVKPLGKGKVVMLGSSFYRKSSDQHGYYEGSHDEYAFYKALFGDLGAAPIVTSDEDKLWSERFVSNNGSTEMLILGSRVNLDGVAATWDVGFHPARVFDPIDGSDVKVTIDGNKVKFEGLHFDSNQLRYYAVSRTDWTARDSFTHWLDRQTSLWHNLTIAPAEVPVETLHPINLMGPYAVKQFTDEAAVRKAQTGEVDASWRQMRSADAEAAGLSTGKDVITVFRKTFSVTPAWLKGLRGVEIMSTMGSGAVGPLELAINGTVVLGPPDADATEKVLAALKPGTNSLTILCKAGGDGNNGFDNLFALRRLPAGKIIDISGDWTGVSSDTTNEPVNFPAKGKWTLVRKNLTLTDEMKAAGSIWCEVEGETSAVSVNGHVIYYSSRYGADYPPGKTYRVNITAALKKDSPNEIAVGPGTWINGSFQPSDFEAKSVKLVLVPKD